MHVCTTVHDATIVVPDTRDIVLVDGKASIDTKKENITT